MWIGIWIGISLGTIAAGALVTLGVFRLAATKPAETFASGGIVPASGGNVFVGVQIQESAPVELGLTFGTSPIVAARAWNLVRLARRDGTSEVRLAPFGLNPAGPVLWPPRRRMEALCVGYPHEAPDPNCQCGVWALRAHVPTGAAVFGSVYLWGRVIEFEQGYRAQYAYPAVLNLRADYGSQEDAEELERLYGIPVRRVEVTG